MVAIDLFAGCGGMTQGLKDAGFNVVLAVEYDTAAAATYRANHSDVLLATRDIRTITKAEIGDLTRDMGPITLLAACPPCQGFSPMRTFHRSIAVADDRNRLLAYVVRWIDVCRPRVVVIENVPPYLRTPLLATFRYYMRYAGYHDDCGVVAASHFGVPQRRRRMIYLASTECDIRLPTDQSTTTEVGDVLSRLPRPGTTDDPLHTISRSDWRHVLIASLTKPDTNGWCDWPDEYRRWFQTHYRSYWSSTYGRLSADRPARTIISNFGSIANGYLHPRYDRPLTPREAACIQTFPDTYRFVGARTQIALQIANAVPPRLISELLRRTCLDAASIGYTTDHGRAQRSDECSVWRSSTRGVRHHAER